MPVRIVAPGDAMSGSELELLLSTYVTQYAADGGDVLRVTAGEAEPEGLFAAASQMLERLGCNPDHAPDIEIMPGRVEDIARAGDLVVACDHDRRSALAERGVMALDSTSLPAAPATATQALRRTLGYTALYWIAETRWSSGYAAEARMFVQALEEAGLEPALGAPHVDRRSGFTLSFSTERLMRRCEQRRPHRGGALGIWHRQPVNPEIFQGFAATACRTMWETDTLPTGWSHVLNRYHRVWVPTEWGLEVFAASGVDERRLRVLPGTIDFDLYRPQGHAMPIAGRRSFAFLSTFDFHERKGWRPLLEAYVREFDADDDVTLVLKVDTGFADRPQLEQRINVFLDQLDKPAHRRPHILFMYDRLSDHEMPALFRGCDAYVSPTRGEGWGRPQMEALACGLPVITSRFSGPLGFLDDSNAWLVDGRIVDVPADVDLPIFLGGRWFDPDVEALQAAMRAVMRDPVGARRRALAGRGPLAERFSLPAIAERVAELTLDAFAG